MTNKKKFNRLESLKINSVIVILIVETSFKMHFDRGAVTFINCSEPTGKFFH